MPKLLVLFSIIFGFSLDSLGGNEGGGIFLNSIAPQSDLIYMQNEETIIALTLSEVDDLEIEYLLVSQDFMNFIISNLDTNVTFFLNEYGLPGEWTPIEVD